MPLTLTENEHRIARALATTGASNKAIARTLGITELAVKSALHNIGRKWHTLSRTQLAVMYAHRYPWMVRDQLLVPVKC